MDQVFSQIEAVNAALLADEPHNISLDEHSGYTGYKPQYIVDAMNKVFGIGGWGFEEVSSDIVPGEKGGLAIAQVKVWLKDIPFQPCAWGQNRVTRGDVGDARKGAQTDAIKKALSYFSIGARAYHGLLEKTAAPTARQQTQQKHPQSAPRPLQPVAQSEQQQSAPVQSKAVHEMIGKAKTRAVTLGLVTPGDQAKAQWAALVATVLGQPVEDSALTLDQVAKINGHLTKVEQAAKSAA